MYYFKQKVLNTGKEYYIFRGCPVDLSLQVEHKSGTEPSRFPPLTLFF
jgi:hypothetical protein